MYAQLLISNDEFLDFGLWTYWRTSYSRSPFLNSIKLNAKGWIVEKNLNVHVPRFFLLCDNGYVFLITLVFLVEVPYLLSHSRFNKNRNNYSICVNLRRNQINALGCMHIGSEDGKFKLAKRRSIKPRNEHSTFCPLNILIMIISKLSSLK